MIILHERKNQAKQILEQLISNEVKQNKMVNNDFENGRKLQKLETQINQIHIEIINAKENALMRKTLKPVLEQAFKDYYDLATRYQIPSHEIRNISSIYNIHTK